MTTFEGRSTALRFASFATFSNPFYPACKINGENVYNEKIMSMPSIMEQTTSSFSSSLSDYIEGTPVHYFFFLYNLENYYHFLYDTLPYLVQYKELKEKYPTMKLLISPTHQWCAFQKDTLSLFSINSDDCVVVKEGDIYSSVIIPPSLTHGGHSNEPPSSRARDIWKKIGEAALVRKETSEKLLPKKFYVSRRSWIHGDTSNMGTNYTTRRRCINENEVVDMLVRNGYEEVFCEKLSMEEKIKLFANATHVVGCIGGGMANLLFSQGKTTKAFCIDTPDFLKINARFVHSMNHTDIKYLPFAQHAPFEGPYPLFTRVRVKETGKIGEIEEYSDGQYTVMLSQNNIAGFALGAELPHAFYLPFELEPLDGGLNSPYSIDTNSLEKEIQEV